MKEARIRLSEGEKGQATAAYLVGYVRSGQVKMAPDDLVYLEVRRDGGDPGQRELALTLTSDLSIDHLNALRQQGGLVDLE